MKSTPFATAERGVIALEGHCPCNCEHLSMSQTQVWPSPRSPPYPVRRAEPKAKPAPWEARAGVAFGSSRTIKLSHCSRANCTSLSCFTLDNSYLSQALGMLVLSHEFASSLLSWQYPQVAVQGHKKFSPLLWKYLPSFLILIFPERRPPWQNITTNEQWF